MAKKAGKDLTFTKANPTYFPMGMGIKKTEDNMIIIEFIDSYDDKSNEKINIIGSFSLTEHKAKELVKALNEAIDKK